MVQTGISNHSPNSSSRNPMSILRLVILCLCGILAIPSFGLIIHQTVVSARQDITVNGKPVQNHGVNGSEITGLIAAIFTLVLVATFAIVSRTRRDTWIVYTVTEIIACGILWILWLVTAARAIRAVSKTGDCLGKDPSLRGSCNDNVAIEGLSVTIFVLLLIYVLSLIVVAAVRSMSRGSSVWFQPVENLQTSPSNSTVHMMPQTNDPGSPGVGREKPSPDMNTGVPVTVAHPNGMGPNRTGYPAHVASP